MKKLKKTTMAITGMAATFVPTMAVNAAETQEEVTDQIPESEVVETVTEETKAYGQAQDIESAEAEVTETSEALETATDNLDSAKESADTAQEELDDANQSLEDAKTEQEDSTSAAEDAFENVEADSEEAVNEAETEVSEAEDAVSEAEDKVETATDDLNKAEQTESEKEENLETVKEENDNVTDEDVNNAQTEVDNAQSEVDKAEDNVEKEEADVDAAQEEVDKAQDQVDTATDNVTAATEALKKAEEAVQAAEDRVENAQKKLDAAKAEVDSPEFRAAEKAYQDALADYNKLVAERDSQQEILNQLNANLSDAEDTLEQENKEHSDLVSDLNDAKEDLKDLNEVLDSKEDAKDKADADVVNKQETADSLKDKVDAAQDAVTAAKGEESAAQTEVNKAQQTVTQKEQAVKDAEKALADAIEAQKTEGIGFYEWMESLLSDEGKKVQTQAGGTLADALEKNKNTSDTVNDPSAFTDVVIESVIHNGKYAQIVSGDVSAYSYDMILKALDRIDEYNKIRENEGLHTSYVGLGTMIAATANANMSAVIETHTGRYYLGENLAIMGASKNPFDYWYTDEKILDEGGNPPLGSTTTGHYAQIIADLVAGHRKNMLVGFGIHSDARYYKYEDGSVEYGSGSQECSIQNFSLTSLYVNGEYIDFDDLDAMSVSERHALGI